MGRKYILNSNFSVTKSGSKFKNSNIYFGMAFSFGVEMLNMALRKRMKKRRLVGLNEPLLNKKKEEDYSDMTK